MTDRQALLKQVRAGAHELELALKDEQIPPAMRAWAVSQIETVVSNVAAHLAPPANPLPPPLAADRWSQQGVAR